jgi:hypothetical protein
VVGLGNESLLRKRFVTLACIAILVAVFVTDVVTLLVTVFDKGFGAGGTARFCAGMGTGG